MKRINSEVVSEEYHISITPPDMRLWSRMDMEIRRGNGALYNGTGELQFLLYLGWFLIRPKIRKNIRSLS